MKMIKNKCLNCNKEISEGVIRCKNCWYQKMGGDLNPAKKIEARNKIKESRKVRKEKLGYINSPETRIKSGKLIKENAKNNPNFGMRGKHQTKEANQKNKIFQLKNYKEHPERIVRMKINVKIAMNKQEVKDLVSLKTKEAFQKNPDIRLRTNQRIKAFYNTKEGKEMQRNRRKDQICPKKDTTIEVTIQTFLKQLNIEFFTHQYIKDIEHGYQCDIFIPIQDRITQKTIIEADGNWWHKYPLGEEIDHIRTKELIEKGYRVIRIWENEIRIMTLNDFKTKLEEVKIDRTLL